MAFLDRLVHREGRNSEPPAAVARRVKMLSDHELISWIDTTVVSAGRHATAGARVERPEEQAAYLDEAQSDVRALDVMIQELRDRRGL